MIRRTKIVATLGPACSDSTVLRRMILAGVDVVRINFSHGTREEHIAYADLTRNLARATGYKVGILADLQGPKIRIGKFDHGKIWLKAGDEFILDADCELGNEERVGLDYKELPNDVEVGATLLLDDGRIVFNVTKVVGNEIYCQVKQGGVLSNNKGINRKGGGLSAPALTTKDKQDIQTAAALKADYLAVSFPRTGEDIRQARTLMQEAGGNSLIMAKIERSEAILALDDILDASDAIMVARGDLAVEVGDAAVPALQKRMIRSARAKNKLVITATQMMESMIINPIPTRAEVSDVANAVLDGTDAVMLSAESAAGQYPTEAVEAMARVCLEAEKEYIVNQSFERSPETQLVSIEEAIARAAMYTATGLKIRAIAALTQSGVTALLMSRRSSKVPIFALSPQEDTLGKMTLFRGVYPIEFGQGLFDPEAILGLAEDELFKRGAVRDGDLIVMTIGEPVGKSGGTNTMKIVRVGDHRKSRDVKSTETNSVSITS
ncbi:MULTISPECIES: pyruvate kinase [Nitrosomonas]|uniref:Pyruvate kinase n=1 Tax=Nitrosomonas communis TaxID=44574 RepID=A0A0F7KHR5_9PROT|nr:MULTISPECIES: pyruvate kinase [Nitrosomonas]AKH38359.1 pyruvate kinase [Nitrosomonas communis]TYP90102.1 pyruvate kinase [Nitrosomonas communis]UVS60364.1 pyruvate kinase [Nitrosomonas sp. PLL12]